MVRFMVNTRDIRNVSSWKITDMALEGHRENGTQFTQVSAGRSSTEAAYGLQAVHEELTLHYRRSFYDWVWRSFLRNARGASRHSDKKLHSVPSVRLRYAWSSGAECADVIARFSWNVCSRPTRRRVGQIIYCNDCTTLCERGDHYNTTLGGWVKH